jgi:hypothetical protein
MRFPVRLLSALLLVGCSFTPPAPPAPRSSMSVNASFGKTWDAVIDVFAQRNIPIRTLERASGFVAAEVASVERVQLDQEHPWADCGRPARGFPMQPTTAFYNVRVKGDSMRSTVQVTVNWNHIVKVGAQPQPCSTKGVWESETETDIKARAEGNRIPDRPPIRSLESQKERDVTSKEPTPVSPTSPASGTVRTGASASIGAPSSEEARTQGAVAFARAKDFVGSHQWTKAEQAFREALQFDGSVAAYHAGLGSLLMTFKRWDEAEAEFSAAMLLDVDNAGYRKLLKTARAKR